MRNLASIKTIQSIHDIPGKDRIGLATIDGWSVIVQKSEFNVGDKCIYCEEKISEVFDEVQVV